MQRRILQRAVELKSLARAPACPLRPSISAFYGCFHRLNWRGVTDQPQGEDAACQLVRDGCDGGVAATAMGTGPRLHRRR